MLDEVIDALRGFLPQEELCAFWTSAAGLEVVLTGHSLPEWRWSAGQTTITHMVKEKHPYDRGVTARREIEF